MWVRRYGVQLKSLQVEDIEMVRAWRNSEHVKNSMEYQDFITEEMQKRWYAGLDKNKNQYFIIYGGEMAVGVMNLKDINPEQKTAEAGIFIGDTASLNTLIPVAATFIVMELAFEELGLEKLRAKIHSRNQKAITFNLGLGYQKENISDTAEFQYYIVNKTGFFEKTKQLRETLLKIG